MAKWRRTTADLGERGILGDEDAAELRRELDSMRTRLDDVEARVHAQFTSIAAHAEIARSGMEESRAEARHDLERTRELLLGLLDETRREAAHGRLAGPGPSVEVQQERLAAVETSVSRALEAVARCERRQQELAETMAAFLDTMLFDRNDSASIDALALR